MTARVRSSVEVPSSLSDWSLADRGMERRFALRPPGSDGLNRLATRDRGYRHPALVDVRWLPLSLPGTEGEDPLDVPGHGHQAPLAADLVEPAQQELPKAQNRLDDAEHRLWGVLALAVELLAFGRGQAVHHGFERRRVLRCRRCRGEALVQGRVMRYAAERQQRLDPRRSAGRHIGGAEIAAVAEHLLRRAQIRWQSRQLAQHRLKLLLVPRLREGRLLAACVTSVATTNRLSAVTTACAL